MNISRQGNTRQILISRLKSNAKHVGFSISSQGIALPGSVRFSIFGGNMKCSVWNCNKEATHQAIVGVVCNKHHGEIRPTRKATPAEQKITHDCINSMINICEAAGMTGGLD